MSEYQKKKTPQSFILKIPSSIETNNQHLPPHKILTNCYNFTWGFCLSDAPPQPFSFPFFLCPDRRFRLPTSPALNKNKNQAEASPYFVCVFIRIFVHVVSFFFSNLIFFCCCCFLSSTSLRPARLQIDCIRAPLAIRYGVKESAPPPPPPAFF